MNTLNVTVHTITVHTVTVYTVEYMGDDGHQRNNKLRIYYIIAFER